MALMIRKFNSRHFTVDDLIWAHNMEKRIADQLKGDVESRRNILIGAGTETGKKPLLNALGKLIRRDGRELLIPHPSEIHMGRANWVRFDARQPQNDPPAVTTMAHLKGARRDLLRETPCYESLGRIGPERLETRDNCHIRD